MPDQMALALLAMALVLGYILTVFALARWLARTLAGMIGSRRGQTIVDEDTGIEYDADDEVVEREWVRTGAGGELRSYSRADVRTRMWYFLVIFPVLVYLHYQFWDALVLAFEWVFQHLGDLIVRVFYSD